MAAVDQHHEHVVRRVQSQQLVEQRPGVLEQEVRHHRHHRRLAQQAEKAVVDPPRLVIRPFEHQVLIRLQAVDRMVPANLRPDEQAPRIPVERNQADPVLKERAGQGQGRDRPRNHAGNRRLGRPAAGRQRRVGHDDQARRARLLEFARHQRTEVGQRRLRPVDRRQPVARLPVPQARELEPRPLKDAGVGPRHVLPHAPHDDQLDVLDLGPANQLVAGAGSHGIGTRSMISPITASTETPWPAACGASQMRWPSTYPASSCTSSG